MTLQKILGHLGLAAALATTLAAAPTAVLAQATGFPSKPIKIVVPYPPGGATDVAARMVAPRLQEELGQPVTVDNRPGAGGNIAMTAVAQSPADGHTLVMTLTGMLSINPVIFKTPGFTAADFVPVAQVSTAPLILVVPANSPYKTVPELLAAGKKAGKDGMPYGSAGAGGLSHLASETINGHADGNFVHVPYKGGAPLTQALMANEVAWGLLGTADARGLVQSGKLRAIGVTTAKRSKLVPELPTIAESGLPGYEVTQWYGMQAPAGTPKDIIARINSEVGKILAMPDIGEKLVLFGAEAAPSTPEFMTAYVKSEVEKWAKVVKASGAKAD